MVERVVYVGSTTQVHVRLPDGEALQSLTANTGAVPDWPAGTPVAVTLPPDALRALPTLTAWTSTAGPTSTAVSAPS